MTRDPRMAFRCFLACNLRLAHRAGLAAMVVLILVLLPAAYANAPVAGGEAHVSAVSLDEQGARDPADCDPGMVCPPSALIAAGAELVRFELRARSMRVGGISLALLARPSVDIPPPRIRPDAG